MTLTWSGAPDTLQVPFGRLFRRLDRAVPENAEIVTAYTDGTVTLRSSRAKIGYHEAADLSGFKGVEEGDFVVHGLDILRGSVGIADSAGAITSVCTVCEPLVDLDLRYVAHVIRLQARSGFTRALARGIREGGADFRRWGTLAELPILFPLVEYQREVCDYLDRATARIDTLIEEQQRLIELLRERRAAVVDDASETVQTTGQRLKHVIRSVRQGWSPQCYPWPADGVETWAVLKAGATNGGVFRPMENKELPETETPRPEIVVSRGDLIISRANTRDLVGSAAVVDGDYPKLMLCDKLYAFIVDKTQVLPRFVSVVLGSRKWRDMIELEATGASHSMLNVSQSDIVNLPVPLPSLVEQRQILASLDKQTEKIDALVAEIERFIELARERREALITAAVTGQIDVREMA